MRTYRNMSRLPGPGDEETWGPCYGHPLDPRTGDLGPSEDEIEDECNTIMEDRVDQSLDWVYEAFSEASEEDMTTLWRLVLRGRHDDLGEHVQKLVEAYIRPSDEEATESLIEKAKDYDPRI